MPMLAHMGAILSPLLSHEALESLSGPLKFTGTEFTGLRGPPVQSGKTQSTTGLFIAGLLSPGPSIQRRFQPKWERIFLGEAEAALPT